MDRMEAFRILASADRQLVLHELVEADDPTRIGAISRQVAARRHRTPPQRIDEEKVERARVRLIHSHLPRLREQELIDVDRDENEISLADSDSTTQLFDAANELDSWPPDDLLEHPARRR
ncbi:DUF7344 domain-containing protein [Halopiger xanaduensis]|uniref:DUF7344 domain-containing protein n=1 Tax=Halopiger xanaduensis (strain DSM 18323 / JCM 14033 / SH-6) TaxID=797210 RepID=F8D6Y1_HALXS|nr:hypothetical protein [Halopiger xanaduensis]AEH35410.1 hypothetical protein Halxa_0771 [Halopiger xanaduensis SH-6]